MASNCTYCTLYCVRLTMGINVIVNISIETGISKQEIFKVSSTKRLQEFRSRFCQRNCTFLAKLQPLLQLLSSRNTVDLNQKISEPPGRIFLTPQKAR